MTSVSHAEGCAAPERNSFHPITFSFFPFCNARMGCDDPKFIVVRGSITAWDFKSPGG